MLLRTQQRRRGNAMAQDNPKVLIEFAGVYGGRRSREEVLRVLKEALALVENVEAPNELICSGFRIEVTRPQR
jgi:hypothetical protein